MTMDGEPRDDGQEVLDDVESLDRSMTPELEEAVEAAMEAEDEDVEKGIEAWKNAWKTAPGHPDVLESLVRLYEQKGQWHTLADLIKKQANSISDEAIKINALMTLAKIYDEHMKQDVMVVNTYQNILKSRKNYLPAINAAIEKYESMERWPDLVKVMKLKGEAVSDPQEKVDVWLTVADLFNQRFSNQAETIKAYEAVLKVDKYHDVAISYLKEMYEKRRDWEKLIDLMEREISQIPDESERAEKLIEIAELTSERIRRPNICTERWEAVLNIDPDNTKALEQLSSFYERTKEWEKLANVLKKQLDTCYDDSERAQKLQKLGQVYDKVDDNQSAIEVFKQLLDINPDDRRAQEQLKKRYLAAQAWDELELFYSESGKWDEFIRILEREADKSSTPLDNRIAMQFKVAELWQEKKERQDRAAKAYETILTLDPKNLDAAEALIPILESTSSDPEKLADVLEVRLAHMDDESEKLDLIRRIAGICENDIGNAQRAFSGFLNAFSMAPAQDESCLDLERLAGVTGSWDIVFETYTAELGKADDDVNLKLRIARILDEELNQQDDALAYYDGILKDDPKNTKAVSALEKLYAHMGRYEELLEIYAKRLDMADNDEERQEILYNQALLWEEEVKDNKKAIDVLLHMIELAGDEQRSLSALDRLYTVEEQWDELANVIERQLALGMIEPEEELALKFKLGQVSENFLQDKAKALSCYQEILSFEPGHQGAVEALEALLSDSSQQAEASRVLAPYYEENEEWEKLVGVIDILVSNTDDESDKYEHLLRIGEIYTTYMMSSERAFVAYSRAFRVNPSDTRALEKLEEITTILDSWSDFVELLSSQGEGIEDLDVKRDVWLRAARIYETQLDNVDSAISSYKKALGADPGNDEAIDALQNIYNTNERWEDLIKIYKTKVSLSEDPEDKEHIYLQMAGIYQEMLDSPDNAIVCLKEVLTFDPENLRALKELDQLLCQEEKWAELADNLLAQLNLGGDIDDTIRLNLRLASLREKELDEAGAAVEIYKEVLEIDPSNEEAIEALERIIDTSEQKREVARILEPIYHTLGSWEKLIGVYGIMVETDEEVPRKVELLHKTASLYENQCDEPEKAFETLGKAIRIDPADEMTQEELERLARILVLYENLADMYSSVVTDIDNFELKAGYHLKIAQIYDENLQDVEKAVSHYRSVLEVDPMHLEAITALEGAYQRLEDYDSLAITFLKKVEMVDSPEEQKDLLFKASQIYEEVLENVDKAIEVYRRILDIDEDDLQAITQIEALYLHLERWDELQEIYNKKVELVDTSEEKREVLYVLGAMYEREVGDVEKAINTYQRVLEFDPDDVQSIQRLDVLYSENEEWHDLLSILEREIELSADPDEAVSFKYRVGELYVKHLDDVSRAIEYFEEILAMTPDHHPSLKALEALIQQGEGAMAAAAVLEPIYYDTSEWRKLIGILEVKLSHSDDPLEKIDLLHRIAETLESDLYLDVPSEAFDAYARALSVDPSNEKTLDKLEDLASQANRWRDLAELYDKQLDELVDAEQAILIGLKAGAIYEENLSEIEASIERYKKVLSFDDQNSDALAHLEQLYLIQEQWDALTDVLQKESLIADDPEVALELQYRMGQVYQRELEQTAKAIEVYREILSADPAHEMTLAALERLFGAGQHRVEIAEVIEPIYRMHAEWEKLVALYEAQLDDIESAEERVQLMHQIAEIQEENVLDSVEAFNWYCKAFAASPLNERSQEEVDRLAGAIDGWVDLADLYERTYNDSQDLEVQKLSAKRLAVVAETHLNDIARAEGAYRGCLDLGDDDLSVLTALDRIYTQYMEWGQLTDILGRLSEVVQDQDEKVAYIYRLGSVLETELEEVERARQCYHRIIEDLEPGHIESLERLEIIYADNEMWAELFEVYSHMKGATDSDAESADLLAKMATIASECLDDIKKSVVLWEEVLDLRGEDADALESLAELYSRQENWSDLVDVLERAVTVAEDDEARVRIYSQLGLVWGECLDRDNNALENWQNALAIDPDNMDALTSIARIHEANKDWDSLLEVIENIVSVGATSFEDDALKGYYAKQGRIYGEILEQPLDAIDAWRNAHQVDSSDMSVYEALEVLYKDQEMWEDLVEILGEKAVLLEGQERIDTLLERAKIFEDSIEEPLRAKSSYTGILEVEPLHDMAFEKLVEIETEEENWEELNQYYYGRLNFIEDLEERIHIYHAVADIFENRLNQPDNAYIVMQRAFEEDYTNDDTADHLERLASVTGNWEQLLDVANKVLTTVDDRNIQISLFLKVGKWYADELGNPEYAIECYKRVIQLDSENATAWSLTGRLYRANKQWDEYVEVLKRAVEFEEDDSKRKNLLVELGETYEEYLKDIPEARTAYKEALSLDPGLEPAIVALERLYSASENWRELITVLRSKREVLDDPDSIINTHVRIGEIFEDNLDESAAAVDEYRAVLELEESNVLALQGLERLYQKLERWQDLLDILEIELQYSESERERIDILARIGLMLEKEFLKPEQAASRYEEILEIDQAQWETLESLERIYRQTGRWPDLVQTLERHIDALSDRNERIPIYEQLGDVWASELKDAQRAIDVYQEILDIDPDHVDALDSLAKLQTRGADWGAAHDTLKRLAETVVDPDRKIDLYYRLGEINEESLRDRDMAVEHFRSALDLEPGHLPSLSALKSIYLDEKDWLAATRVLDTEQEYTENPRKKAGLQYELGYLYEEKLKEEDAAIEWYEKSLQSDDNNVAAAEPLVRYYIRDERFEEAEPLLEMLIRLGAKRTGEEMQAFQRQLGLVADKNGDLDKSLKAYQSAYELNTSDLDTLLKLADVYFRKEIWEKAFKYYQMVLVHHRDKQKKDETVEIFYRLGYIKAKQKERRKALNMFDKALEIDNKHKNSLYQVIELHADAKNFEQVIHFKKELLNAVDDDEKFNLLVEIGDIWHERLKNPQKAISSYNDALSIRPDDRPVLHKVLPLYQSTKQWQKVVEVILSVAEMEEDPNKLGQIYYSVGVIYRDEIKNAEEAVTCFNRSLDASIENLKAFEAIDRILTQRKDWKNLARAYRKMLHRISGRGRPDLEINLWHFLGEIYRTRMQQFEPAAEAFKIASTLDPDNNMRHEILAELYVSLPGRMDDAVKEYQWMIEKNPYNVDSYKALRKLYFDNRQFDKAWCLCSTLSFLKKASAEEQQFFEQYRTKGMIRAQSRLDNEAWIKYLFHADESPYVGKIMEAVTNVTRRIRVQPAKAFGLKRGQKRPLNDTMMFSKTFYYAAQVLNLPVVPELYVQEDKASGLEFAITDPMASVCGASLLTGYSPQDLLFVVAKHLNYYRPEHYIRWVLPTHAELKTLLLASIKMGMPDFKLPQDRSGVLEQWVRSLSSNIQPIEVEALTKFVRTFIKTGENIDVKKWINAVEMTGCRAGFLMCNDLEIAARMIQSETVSVDETSPKEKIKELVVFSVSEEYFKLRESLGIAITSG